MSSFKKHSEVSDKPQNIYKGLEAIKCVLAVKIPLKKFYSNSKDNDPASYITDVQEITSQWQHGERRFKAFLGGRFVVLDIDRKLGKVDGLEAFYKLWPQQILPAELRDIECGSFPCYVTTPSGGFHLYFRYYGQELKIRELAPGVELKEWQITAPGSSKENGEYILYGDFSNVQPFYGLFLDRIEKLNTDAIRLKEETRSCNARAYANRSIQFEKPRISLEDLAAEAATAYAGNHDRQVSFAGRAFRCKFSASDALAYVKIRSDIFGNGSDTENTIMSVFHDNGGRL